MTNDLNDFNARSAAIGSMSLALQQIDDASNSMKEALSSVITAMKSVNSSEHEFNVMFSKWNDMLDTINATRKQVRVTRSFLVHGNETEAAPPTRPASSKEEILSGILDWYRALPEPGLVPNSLELTARLREAHKALGYERFPPLQPISTNTESIAKEGAGR